ncbi:MAG: hypothetical protein ABSH50_03475 [Bryobacteraceae bacterium]|jgi:hypothetical protein
MIPATVIAQSWTKEHVSDALHNASYEEYRLAGKFLAPPQQAKPSAPVLVVHCQPGEHARSKTAGHFEGGWIDIGVKVASKVSESSHKDMIPVDLRLDDGKPQNDIWAVMPGEKQVSIVGSVLLPTMIVAKLFYNKPTPHKEGSPDQVHKIFFGVYERDGGQIQMEFDLPDVTEVADACGLIRHAR